MCFSSSKADSVCNPLSQRSCIKLATDYVALERRLRVGCPDSRVNRVSSSGTHESKIGSLLTCCDLNSICHKIFRVARRLAVQLPEVLGIFQLHANDDFISECYYLTEEIGYKTCARLTEVV